MQIKSNFIIVCDQAFLTAGSNNLNLVGIFSQINTQQFPVKYPRFALVVNFTIDRLDKQTGHTLETTILGPNGDQIAQAKLPVHIPSSPFQVISNFENLSFPTPGTYELKVSLDGNPIGSSKIELRTALVQKPGLA